MADESVRLDGWKAIAGYVKRDRSTAIRWAQKNGLPVRRIQDAPGGAVFAYKRELDAWLSGGGEALTGEPPVPAPAAPQRTPMRTVLAGAGGLALIIAVLALAALARPSARASRLLPEDAAMTRVYLQARDDWAKRTPQSLRAAIAEFGEVIRREPRFAPAYAGLADAYILAPEFADMAQGAAFMKAQAAAQQALALDPDDAGAHRALAFIAYWWRHDISATRREFARALSADPDSAQTHFWFGNILLDNGERAAGLAELQKALALDPDSPSLQTDYAWASWSNGSDGEGVRMLEAVEAEAPNLSSAPYYRAMIALANGDVAGYLEHARRWVALQGDDNFKAEIAADSEAFRTGGAQAALDAMASDPPSANAHVHDSSIWPAGAASLAGRRDKLLELLADAQATGEHWRSQRWERMLFARWRGDREVQARLARLVAPEAPRERIATS
jgi:tetratricopeptide (TPR) repeat protein